MITGNVVLLGIKNSVHAFDRKDGRPAWSTKLPGSSFGGDFVILHADGLQVFAYASGQLTCLELSTGRILWTDPLKGLGYGLATLVTPGSNPAGQAAVLAIQAEAERRRSDGAGSGPM